MIKHLLPYLIGFDDPDMMSGFGRSLTPLQQRACELWEETEDKERSITYETFSKHVEGLEDWATQHGYAIGREPGLKLKNDYHVQFFKSTFGGYPCYHMKWSGYQYIWCDMPQRELRLSPAA